MAETKKRKIVFMGTPDFAANILAKLLESPDNDVIAVYTQADKPAGRGHKLVPPPVKQLALTHSLPVYQPATFKDEDAVAFLASLQPDFLIVAAYGMLLPESVLAIPRFAPINIHTSLLPAYRGSAPIQRALMDGLAETGFSIMRMDIGLDTGPVYAQQTLPTANETTGSLLDKVAEASVPLLCSVLAQIEAGTLEPTPQVGETSYARKIQKSESQITCQASVAQTDCLIRALTPNPGARISLCLLGQAPMNAVLEVVRPGEQDILVTPGEVLASKTALLLACADGYLNVLQLKPAGKKSMSAQAFVNGLRLKNSDPTPIGFVEPRAEDGHHCQHTH